MNENFHNSRTSNDIDMKLGLVTKLDKRTLKKFDNDLMSTNYDVIVIFPVYGQFGDSRSWILEVMVGDTYISIHGNFLPYKN